MVMKITKLHKRLLGVLFVVLIVTFFVIYLRGIDYNEIRKLSISWPTFVIASLFSLAFRYWGVFIWRTILKDLGSKELPPFHLLSSVYAKAWMGRYIPGSVTLIAGKIYLASSIGISKSRLAVASLLEAIVQIVAVATVSLFLVGFDSRSSSIPTELKLLLVAGAVVLLVSLHPSLFNRAVRFIFEKVRGKKAYSELSINNKAVSRSFILYAIGTFISGLSYFFLTKSIEPTTSWNLFFYIVGAYNLAGVIGIATPFVPSGLGVRDGAQLILLSAVFPKEIALALTIVSRLWSAIVDILFFLIAQLHHLLFTSQQTKRERSDV